MGLTDMMKQSNQSSNEDVVDVFPDEEDHKTAKKDGAAKIRTQPAVIPSDGDGAANMLSNSMWSSDGLLSSTRLFQRSNSTPPTHVDAFHGNQRQVQNTTDAYKFNRFHLRETVEENNQEDDVEDLDRHDLVMPIGKHIQRAWSAPPVPHNFDAFFAQRSSGNDKQRTRMAALEKTGLRGIAEDARPAWNDGGSDSGKTQEKTGINTISPVDSPSTIDHQLGNDCTLNGGKRNSSLAQRGFFPASKRPNPSLMTLVDRVQEDFPRTPSPVFGCPASPTVVLPNRSLDQSMAAAMKQLHVDGDARANAHHHSFQRNDRAFAPPAYQQRVHDFRQAQRVQNHVSYTSSYPVMTPPGFHGSSTARGVYEGMISNDPRAPWANNDDHRGFPGSRFPVGPMDYGMVASTARVPHKGDFYPNRFGGGLYTRHEAPSRPFQGHAQPIFPTPQGYDIHDHHMYIPHPAPVYRSKSGPVRHQEYGIHPAHSYSSTSLLEEFKGAAKSDRWDLRTIQGHLLEFARDQAGSRFIQQKLEKADDRVRDDAFNEVFPEALLLMTDVFGNYVIQKFFDHGSLDQQHRLVALMKKNMINLALQVYGCRVIQKALEASQVEEQLMLIQEMRGHVLKCVVDQNGNHVLQKCIEAASWKNCMNGGGAQHNVLGEDIQFIIDDFVGQAASLSTHAYGCRVIQRVLEHCTPEQIRPIVNEIIYKCRELVKDQFGNYVVQHVVTHGEKDQRDIVMKAILPDVAKWSQHKYASNVVEACLDCATKEEISQVIDIILDCDESGSSCALLPMMKHMYGNYVVQKLLDRAERNDRQRIVRIIQHNADYLKRFTYGKHVLSRLERESNSNHREHGHGRFF